jgi:hypothetical protein
MSRSQRLTDPSATATTICSTSILKVIVENVS